MKINQTKLAENKQDSFWYSGTIATKGKFTLVATGEIKVFYKGETLNEYQALEYAESKNWTDKDLAKFNFDMNNWFEVYEIGSGEGEVLDNYDEAIKYLQEIK